MTVNPLTTNKSATLILLATIVLLVPLLASNAYASRCQISNVSYAYPQTATTNQVIIVGTTVSGSCVSTGEDYYAMRVDLVDTNSGSIISSSNTPIGYNANNFTVTGENSAKTPSANETWPLQIYVYIIRAGGTSGFYLRDYSTIGNATIQVGTIQPVPEFNAELGYSIMLSLSAAAAIISRNYYRRKP